MERVKHYMLDTRHNGRMVVWAHNSHLGDDTYTSSPHQLNLGKLVKRAYPLSSISVGQYCYSGNVTAALNWGEVERVCTMNPASVRSFENIFHDVTIAAQKPVYCVDMRSTNFRNAIGKQRRLQRAIGVVYRSESELISHYYSSEIHRQFDILVWFDSTKPLIRYPVKCAKTMLR